MKRKETAAVLSQREIAPGIYEMWIGTSLAGDVRPGQFLGVYPNDRSTLLPRPISVCEAREAEGAIRLVYRVVGAGTKEFSGCAPGDKVAVSGPLGNGFPPEAARGKRAFLLGGGIGIPPLLELAKCLKAEAESLRIIVGYRDGALFLKEDLDLYGAVYVATEDGSAGTKGNVMDALRENGLEADVAYACGPRPMLRAVKEYAAEHRIPAYLSLEEHMACGVGACLGCVAKTRKADPHSHVNYARICTEGPVFEARDVEL